VPSASRHNTEFSLWFAWKGMRQMTRKIKAALLVTSALPVAGLPMMFAGPAAAAPAKADASSACGSNQLYYILNGNEGGGHPDMNLEVYHSDTDNGATVDQWAPNSTATQQWCEFSVGSGEMEIVNHNSGKCLEVYHSETGNGDKVDQWTCNGTNTQLWRNRFAGWSDWAELQDVNSGKCLEPSGGSWDEGTAMVQETCINDGGDTAPQEWTWIPISQ